MSTKTTLKRIALVAVSALGTGLLSVAPSSAAGANPNLSLATVGTKAQVVSVASTATTTVGFTTAADVTNDVWGTGAGKTATVTLSAPTGSTVTLADNDGVGSGTSAAFSTTGMSTGLGAALNSGTGALTGTAATFLAGAAIAGTISITPDVPGVYSVSVATQDRTAIAYIYAWTSAVNGASLVGVLGDGGFPSNNSSINGVAGPANTVTVRAFPSLSTGTSPVRRLVVVDGASAFIAGTAGVAPTLAAGTTPASATLATNAYSQTALDSAIYTDFVIATPAAGTATVKIYNETGVGSGIFSSTASATVTITVGATGSAGTLSVGLSSVLGTTDNTAAATALTDAGAVPAPGTGNVPTWTMGTGASTLKVRYDIKVRDVLGAFRAASTTSLSATIDGPGLLNTTSSTTGLARVVVIPWDPTYVTTNNPDKNTLFLFNDGTAGKSTVTIYWGSTVLATKTITFTGAPKTLTATAWEPHITVGTIPEAVEVVARDANGNVTNWTTSAISSAPAVISNAVTCTQQTDPLSVALGYVLGGYYCTLTGLSTGDATITFNPGSLTTNSPAVAIKVTKKVAASVVLKTDKDTYAPGEKIVLTIEAKDADGFLLGAKQVTAGVYYDLLAGTRSTSTIAVQGTALSGTSIYLSAGTKSTSLYAPLVSGPVTFSAVLDATLDVAAALQGTVISKKITVSATAAEDAANAAADAAAEAIDAANAATDAANLAAEAADAATVAAEEARDAADAATAAIEELATQVALMAALKAQITTLANTVAKIAKKIKA